MKSLLTFSMAVAVALVVVLAITWFYKGGQRFKLTAVFVAGYIIGFITLLIKVMLINRGGKVTGSSFAFIKPFFICK